MKAWAFAVSMLLVAGCGKEKTAETTDAALTTTTTGDAAVATVSVDASTVDAATTAAEDKPLPTEHKAENKATREITTANYKSEIEKLAKEIGAP